MAGVFVNYTSAEEVVTEQSSAAQNNMSEPVADGQISDPESKNGNNTEASEETPKNENNADSGFSVGASEVYKGISGGTSPVVNTKANVDGRSAVEIINSYGKGETERVIVDMSAYEYPSDVMPDSNFMSVKYKYLPPEGTVVKKGKMYVTLVIGREKRIIAHSISSEEKMVSGGWTTAVFKLDKFEGFKNGIIEQLYIYPFGYHEKDRMTGLTEKIYIGDIAFHETAPDVEEVVQEDTAGKTVVGQKRNPGLQR